MTDTAEQSQKRNVTFMPSYLSVMDARARGGRGERFAKNTPKSANQPNTAWLKAGITVVLRTVESVCASDGNCAAALPTSKNCSPLLRRVALDMVHEAQGIIFIGYSYESSHRNLHKTQNLITSFCPLSCAHSRRVAKGVRTRSKPKSLIDIYRIVPN